MLWTVSACPCLFSFLEWFHEICFWDIHLTMLTMLNDDLNIDYGELAFNVWLYENKTYEIKYFINNICKGYICCRKVFIHYFHNLNIFLRIIFNE